MQPIGAARQPARAVRRLGQQQAETQRDHDQRKMLEARNDEAGEVSKQAGGRGSGCKAAQRLAPAPFRDQACGIGAKAEIGGMAERDDARIAEDEIERERK